MFFNFKKEPFDIGTGTIDADTLSISADDRRLMAVSEGDRKLYVLNINNVENSTSNGLEVGKNVIIVKKNTLLKTKRSVQALIIQPILRN